MTAPEARVVGPENHSRTLGQFLRDRKEASGLPVTQIAKAAGISRANFYLIERGDQRPSLATLVALFEAMGMDCRVPTETDDLADSSDLVVVVGTDEHRVDLRWSTDDRLRSRQRYTAAASAGLKALGVLGPAMINSRGQSATAARSGVNAALGGSTVGLAVVAAPMIGELLSQLADRRRSEKADTALVPEMAASQEELVREFKASAEQMSTEELETVLEAMRAMRSASRQDTNGPTD